MSSAPNVQPSEPSALAAVLSYLIPGLGQIYQGRYGKGVMFMVCLLGMFTLGQAMGQWQNVYLPNAREQGDARGGVVASLMNRWHYAGQFWIGIAAWPAICQYNEMLVPDQEAHPFWHKFQRAPNENDLNRFLQDSDKTPDLGWVYTVIAGMLNILVIYDAYIGPLPSSKQRPRGSPTAGAERKAEGVA
jgi:hypothetical protein